MSEIDLLSIYDIAEETGYSAAGIHKAIERFGIEPDFTSRGGFRYFSPTVVDTLREQMRTSPKSE